MAQEFDKNLAVDHYSWGDGNRADLLHGYCEQAGFTGDIRILAREIEELQGAVWGTILATSGQVGLSERRLERLVRNHLRVNARWMDELGFLALMRWVQSMAKNANIVV